MIEAMLQKLRTSEWAGKTVKIRARGADGKIGVKELGPAEATKNT